MPELAGGKAKRVSVSTVVWEYLVGRVAESTAHRQRKDAEAKQMAADAAIACSLAE